MIAAGIVTERDRIVDTDLSIQRGLALHVTPGALGSALCAYDQGSDPEDYRRSMDLTFGDTPFEPR